MATQNHRYLDEFKNDLGITSNDINGKLNDLLVRAEAHVKKTLDTSNSTWISYLNDESVKILIKTAILLKASMLREVSNTTSAYLNYEKAYNNTIQRIFNSSVENDDILGKFLTSVNISDVINHNISLDKTKDSNQSTKSKSYDDASKVTTFSHVLGVKDLISQGGGPVDSNTYPIIKKMLKAGNGVNLTYDDNKHFITIASDIDLSGKLNTSEAKDKLAFSITLDKTKTYAESTYTSTYNSSTKITTFNRNIGIKDLITHLTLDDVYANRKSKITGSNGINVTHTDSSKSTSISINDDALYNKLKSKIKSGNNNTTITYDDVNKLLKIASTDTNTQLDEAGVYSFVKSILIAGTNISFETNDSNNSITLKSTGGSSGSGGSHYDSDDFYSDWKTKATAGSNITIANDDGDKEFTISATDTVPTEDNLWTILQNKLIAGTNISITKNGNAKTWTIGATVTQGQQGPPGPQGPQGADGAGPSKDNVFPIANTIFLAGTGISKTVDQTNKTITFSLTNNPSGGLTSLQTDILAFFANKTTSGSATYYNTLNNQNKIFRPLYARIGNALYDKVSNTDISNVLTFDNLNWVKTKKVIVENYFKKIDENAKEILNNFTTLHELGVNHSVNNIKNDFSFIDLNETKLKSFITPSKGNNLSDLKELFKQITTKLNNKNIKEIIVENKTIGILLYTFVRAETIFSNKLNTTNTTIWRTFWRKVIANGKTTYDIYFVQKLLSGNFDYSKVYSYTYNLTDNSISINNSGNALAKNAATEQFDIIGAKSYFKGSDANVSYVDNNVKKTITLQELILKANEKATGGGSAGPVITVLKQGTTTAYSENKLYIYENVVKRALANGSNAVNDFNNETKFSILSKKEINKIYNLIKNEINNLENDDKNIHKLLENVVDYNKSLLPKTYFNGTKGKEHDIYEGGVGDFYNGARTAMKLLKVNQPNYLQFYLENVNTKPYNQPISGWQFQKEPDRPSSLPLKDGNVYREIRMSIFIDTSNNNLAHLYVQTRAQNEPADSTQKEKWEKWDITGNYVSNVYKSTCNVSTDNWVTGGAPNYNVTWTALTNLTYNPWSNQPHAVKLKKDLEIKYNDTDGNIKVKTLEAIINRMQQKHQVLFENPTPSTISTANGIILEITKKVMREKIMPYFPLLYRNNVSTAESYEVALPNYNEKPMAANEPNQDHFVLKKGWFEIAIDLALGDYDFNNMAMATPAVQSGRIKLADTRNFLIGRSNAWNWTTLWEVTGASFEMLFVKKKRDDFLNDPDPNKKFTLTILTYKSYRSDSQNKTVAAKCYWQNIWVKVVKGLPLITDGSGKAF